MVKNLVIVILLGMEFGDCFFFKSVFVRNFSNNDRLKLVVKLLE